MDLRKLAAAAVAVAALAAGAAYAAIPDGQGVIHGCYEKKSGALRVADLEAGTPQPCTPKEHALDWNQQGPAGADAFADRFGQDTGNAATATSPACTLGEVRLTASFLKTAGGVAAKGQLLPI